MSRPIEFRVWQEHGDGWQMEYQGTRTLLFFFSYVNTDHLMQYTGSLDRNEKKIFEGDILAVDENNNYFVEYRGDRFWLSKWVGKTSHPDGNDGYYRICLAAYCSTSEIIGNVCQQPELLK
jgi:uncharacterized phage protein (TIGR01671 family)